MKGKVGIITGGSSGMGKAMALRFAKEGARVVITGRTKDTLEEAKREIQEIGGVEPLIIVMDVRNPNDVDSMVEQTVNQFGTVDFLVNNAAGNFICKAEDLSINGWNAVINIVLNGTFYCSRSVGKYWIDNRIQGSILNMVATYAWDAGPGVIHSASAKAGVLAMTRTLAVEWGRAYGIRVNAIAPGPIERTGGADRLWVSEEAAQRTIDSVPLKRLGTPEEVASLAKYLLSNESAYINGACVTIDGGQHLHQYPF